jgi:hypothetical protein
VVVGIGIVVGMRIEADAEILNHTINSFESA